MIEKRQTIKKRHRGFAAVAAAALLATALLAQTVHALELDEAGVNIRTCSITVNKESDSNLAGNVAFDVYQIAKATPITGMDAYEFVDFAIPKDSTVSEAETYYNENIKNSEKLDAKTLNAFTQISAEKVKAGTLPKYNTENLLVGDKVNVEAGMYLVILHDKTETNYWSEDASAVISTAKVGEETYSFAPILVSVPTRENPTDAGSTTFVSDVTVFNGTASYANTAGTGSWVYDLSVDPKMGIEEEGVPIEITKTIDTYDASAENVNFVFEVKAVKKLDVDGVVTEKTVYNNIHAITFTPASGLTQAVRIVDEATGKEIRVPRDSEVTVTERNPGAAYITGARTQTVTGNAETTAFQFTFTNTYQETKKSGGAVTNNVHVVPDHDDVSGYKWEITQVMETVE